MTDECELNSVFLRDVYQRLDRGDFEVRNELLVKVQARLERLARKMLRGFPGVRRWEDTTDIVQNATIRLLRALEQVKPESERWFFALAAEQFRRVLIDLARHYQGAHGLGANYASVAGAESPATSHHGAPSPLDPAATDSSSTDLDRWCAFHEAIEQLPATEREVMGLTFYHGWKQTEIAALLQVDERTVRRYWQSACLKLNECLGGDLPI